MSQEEIDIMYMRRCLQLAANGLGRVRPNPLVGCVVVKDGRIVSEGFHQEYGHNHAERNALTRPHPQPLSKREGSENLLHSTPLSDGRGDGGEATTLYVNLEPCSHHGLTPPCADLIIEKGVRRVVCCNDDPNPLVAGNGFRKLEEAGIEVVRHVLEEEGRELNRRFFTFMEQQRPYVILKWAESKDGFMAPSLSPNPSPSGEGSEMLEVSTPLSLGEGTGVRPYWLSTQRQNRLNHRWRTEEAAILVGSESYLQDSPTLTPRHYIGPAPQRVVLDRRGRLSGKTHSFTTAERRSPSPNLGEELMILQTPTIEETLQALYERKLQSVIVEGGRTILDAFIESGLYDEVRILRSPQTLGNGLPAPEIPPIAPNRLIIIDP